MTVLEVYSVDIILSIPTFLSSGVIAYCYNNQLAHRLTQQVAPAGGAGRLP